MRTLLRSIRQFLSELRRRNVYQVAVTYVVVGFFVIEGADLVLTRLGLPSWTVTLVIVLVGLGFPIALVLAWALEMTPEGVRVAESEGGGEPAAASGGFSPTSTGLIVGLLAVAIGLQLYSGVFSSQDGAEGEASPAATDTTQIDDRSIAVLPFEPLSSGEKSNTFARGVHDDLLARLSNISDLTVISRTSVERYRDTNLPLPAIADSLGVRWVMEGGVQKAGEQIQVRAQLIDPRTDGHVWANDYQRRLTAQNLFAIQGDITQKIAEALEAQLTASEQDRITGAPTGDLDAYRLYVRGRNQLARRTPSSIDSARTFFEHALRQDSSYALAWAGLADAAVLYPDYVTGPAGFKKAMRAALPKARSAARRARKLDPTLAEAWTAAGAVAIYAQSSGFEPGNGPAALKALQRAVELKPSYANAQQWLAELYLRLGQPKRALEHASLAVELGPHHAAARNVLIWALLANDEPERARKHYEGHPHDPPRQFDLLALYHSGQWNDLEAFVRERLEDDSPAPLLRFHVARIALLRGDTASARNQLGMIERAEESDTKYFSKGLTHAALGEYDATFTAWQRVEWGVVAGFLNFALRYWYPDILDPLRDDPRYRKLVREANRSWGLNPDGSIPKVEDVSFDAEVDA